MTGTMVKVNIGSYDNIIDGWINTDITRQIYVARVPGLAGLLRAMGILSTDTYLRHKKGVFRKVTYLDARRPFPYGDDSVDCVYTSHMLEHLYPDEASSCVREIHRVLKRGGIARISVPDLDKIITGYRPENANAFLKAMLQQSTRKTHPAATHKWQYNEHSLKELLREAGFASVYRCEFRKGRCPDVEIADNREHSLFMEAVK